MFSRTARSGDGLLGLRRRGAALAPAVAGGEDELEGGAEEEHEDQEVVAGVAGSGADAIEADEWDDDVLDPLMVRFTQEKVHPFFYRRGPIVNVLPKIRPVLHEAGTWKATPEGEEVIELVPPFGPIHCLRRKEEIWSLDNRRLYALQMAAMEQWPQRCRVRVLCRDRLPRHKFKSQYRKFNTTSEGRVVSISARYQQFDTWSWFDRAVDIELYNFSQRFGIVLSCFEVFPVIGALLFRTGLTGFATRSPFVIGFIASFAVDVLRQRVPIIERKFCEYQVLAIVTGEVSPYSNRCCSRIMQTLRRIRGFDEEEASAAPMSAPQTAMTSAVVAVLLLPYLTSIPHERARSGLMSCWLGIGCVLLVQLLAALRLLLSTATATALASLSGAAVCGGGTTKFGRRGSSRTFDEDVEETWNEPSKLTEAAAELIVEKPSSNSAGAVESSTSG